MRDTLFDIVKGRCLRCDVQMTLEPGQPTSLCIDLVCPRSEGGRRTWRNVQPLCQTCTTWVDQVRAVAAPRTCEPFESQTLAHIREHGCSLLAVPQCFGPHTPNLFYSVGLGLTA